MKENKTFNIVSAGTSLLVLILVFAMNFVEIGNTDKGLTAWNLFSGKDGSGGIGIGFLVLLAVILLIVNIILQFVQIDAVTEFAKKYSQKPVNVLVNNITAIACAGIFLIVGFMAPDALKELLKNVMGDFKVDFGGYGNYANAIGGTVVDAMNFSMAAGAWFIIILSASMFFLPKFANEKKEATL